MKERYSLPGSERIERYSPENWRDYFFQYWPGGSRISLSESFVVTEDRELGYKRFTQGEGNEVKFELLLTNEAAEILVRSGKIKTKKEIKTEIAQIRQDPFGQSSIDSEATGEDPEYFRKFRSVNTFSLELEEKLGIPVAVKGLGTSSFKNFFREDLVEQFCFMRQKEKEWNNMPEYIKHILHICKVYAVMRYKIQDKKKYEEWLIMERVPNAKQVESDRLGSVGPERIFGFAVEEEPFLKKIIETETKDPKIFSQYTKRYCYSWDTLNKALKCAGLKVSDIAGRNLLYSPADPHNRHYVVIDQGGRDKSF